MTKITRVDGWYDPGFTESGMKRLNKGTSIATSDWNVTLTTGSEYTPPTEKLFTELQVPWGNYETYRSTSYIKVAYSMNSGSSFTVYGFVDSVEIVSDTASYPSLRFKWHIDYWETYKASLSLGARHITRRPYSAESDTPIQGYERKYLHVSSSNGLLGRPKVDSYTVWWVIFAFADTVNVNDKIVRYYTWPVNLNGHTFYFDSGGGIGKSCPTYAQTFQGMWDEALNVDPQNVYGAWLVPISPFDPTELTVSGGTPHLLSITSNGWESHDTGDCMVFRSKLTATYTDVFYERSSVPSTSVSTELNPLMIAGFQGELIGQVPVGMSVSSYKYRVLCSATECYVEVRYDGWQSRANGLCYTVPALVLDLTQNAWSSYQYSGQREYDIDARNMETVKSGIESMVSGASQGFMLGGFNPAGARMTAMAGAVGGVVSMATDFLWYNNAIQGAKDKLMSRQSAGILLSGAAFDSAVYGPGNIMLCEMAYDSYSAGRASSERSIGGIAVDEYSTTTASSLSAGYWRMDQVEVKGSIPPEAKKYFAVMFNKGVYLT